VRAKDGQRRNPQHEPGQRRAEHRGQHQTRISAAVPAAGFNDDARRKDVFTQVPGYWESSFGRGLDPNPYYKG
jgi:hypothetical protein